MFFLHCSYFLLTFFELTFFLLFIPETLLFLPRTKSKNLLKGSGGSYSSVYHVCIMYVIMYVSCMYHALMSMRCNIDGVFVGQDIDHRSTRFDSFFHLKKMLDFLRKCPRVFREIFEFTPMNDTFEKKV